MKLVDKTWSQGDGAEFEDIGNQVGDFAWVLDGATALVKNDRYTPRWLVHEADRILATGAKTCTNLQELADYYQAHFIADDICKKMKPEEKPSYAMALMRAGDGFIEYMIFADCFLVVRQHGKIHVLTDNKWADLTDPYGTKEFFTKPKEERHQVYLDIRRKMNTPEGYWIGCAEGTGFKNVPPQRLQVEQGAQVLLCTDGFERAVTMFGLYSWNELFDQDLDKVRDELRQAENDDAESIAHPRPKKSDDVFAIRLSLDQAS